MRNASDRTPSVLVVDDEENISFLVASALRLEGIEATVASNGRDALAHVAERPPDMVILDVMMPGLDGFEVLRRLRGDGSRVPVMFLMARESVDDRVAGLMLGGDDYLVKPFALAELIARVHVVLRRGGHQLSDEVFRVADLEMDHAARRVTRAGSTVALSPTEYKLLRYLLVNAGRVVTKAQILDHVWEYDFEGDVSVVETFMSYLRRKVDDVAPKLIHTVRGAGYCLRIDP